MNAVQLCGVAMLLALALVAALWVAWEAGHRAGQREGLRLIRVHHARLAERLAHHSPYRGQR